MIRRRLFHPTQWACFLFAINLALCLGFCFVAFPRLVGGDVAALDPDGYGEAGRVLYETGRLDSIEKAPLYPAFVAATLRLVAFLAGDYPVWAVQAAQCILSAFTCGLLYAVFRRTLGEPAARWAGLACALYPLLAWYTPRLWTETFLTFVLAGFTLALVALLQRPTAGRALLGGAMAGVLALSKGIGLVFAGLAPLVLLLRWRGKAWRWCLLFAVAVVVLIVPWTWRNWRLTGAFLPVHADGGYNFYLGNGFARHWLQAPLSYTALRAYTLQDIEALYASPGVDPPADPLAVDRVLMRAAWAELRAHPLLILRKLAIQSLTFWYLAADVPKSLLTGAFQLPVALAALPGAVQAYRRRSWALALAVPVAGIMGASIVILAFARLSAIIMPYLIGLAVYGLWPERWRCRQGDSSLRSE